MTEPPLAHPPPLPTRPPRPAGGGRGCLASLLGGMLGALLLALLGVAALAGLAAAFGALGGGGGSSSAPTEAARGEDEAPRLREIWSSGTGDVKVVRIPLRGTILLDEGLGGWTRGSTDGADAALRAIRRATADPAVRGLLLELDSGGGGLTASDILFDALLRFKQASPGRAVVAHLGNLAASGAYYVALGADQILAHPTTITGSIGVLLSSFNARELAARLGIRDVTIKSGENKDLLNPLGELSEEQRILLQDVVDQMHARFVAKVVERRPAFSAEQLPLLDGRIFLAARALELGLIDGLGYRPEAEAALAGLLETPALRVVRYEQQFSLRELFRSPGFWGAALSEALPEAAAPPPAMLR